MTRIYLHPYLQPCLLWLLLAILAMSGSPARAQSSGNYRSMPEIQRSSGIDASQQLDPQQPDPQQLMAHFPHVQQPGVRLVLVREIQSPGGRHLQYEQQVEGIPVFGAGIKLNLGTEGRTASCLDYLKRLPASPPALAWEAREQEVLRGLPARERQALAHWRRVWWEDGQALQPAIELKFHDASLGLHELRVVHAQTRELLLTEPLARHWHSVASFADTSGRGRVFIPNPCKRGAVSYGELFVDAEDAHAPIFDALMDTVTLRDLSFRGGRFFLEGPYVKVEDITPPEIAPTSSTTGHFFFNRDEPGFEDVMVYYHIDSMQRYLQSLGYTNLWNQPLRVDPHGLNADVSSFIPNGAESYIRLGLGGVDDAEDADVIIHEYGHALSYAATGENQSGTERRALDEGIGDYWTAVYSQILGVESWFNLFNWDGHNEFWPGRTAATRATYPLEPYPPTNQDIYRYGEIWASTLMRMRMDLGGDIVDRLALEEMYMNAPGMTFPDAAHLLLEADQNLYGGAHLDILTFYLCESGLLDDPSCLSVGRGPRQELPQAVSIFPNPNRGQFRLKLAAPGPALRMEVYNLMGQKIWQQDLLPQKEQHISLNVPEGMYLINVIGAGRALRPQTVWVR